MIAHNAEIHRIQQAFRQVMNAFAHPGACYALPACPDAKTPTCQSAALDTLIRMFVDHATTFYFVGEEPFAQRIAAETRGNAASLEDARFVIVPASAPVASGKEALLKACAGTLLAPETGATVVLECGRISAEPFAGASACALSGPGVKDANVVWVSDTAWVRAREQRGDVYPCGVEILLVDASGVVAAIPRSSALEMTEVR